MSDHLPCRVMLDLSAHEYATRQAEQDSFDETDEMSVGAVVPYDLVKPIMSILALRKWIDQLPPEDVVKAIKEDSEAIHKACLSMWRDL